MQNLNPTLYDVLGRISKHSTAKEIKTAYRMLAMHYHPDKNSQDKAWAEEKMRELNAAYEILSNPQKRNAYNEKLRQDDERLKQEELLRKKKEAEEKRKKQMDEEAKRKIKFHFKDDKELKKQTANGDGAGAALAGVALGLAALGLLIYALSDDEK